MSPNTSLSSLRRTSLLPCSVLASSRTVPGTGCSASEFSALSRWLPTLKFAAENSFMFFILGHEMQHLTRLLGFGVGIGLIWLKGRMFKTSTQSSESSTTGGRVGALASGRKNGYMGGLWAVALILDAEKLGINGGLGFGFLCLTGEAKGLTGLEG